MLVLAYYFWLPTSTMHRRIWQNKLDVLESFGNFGDFLKINIVEFVTKKINSKISATVQNLAQ